MPLTGNKSRFAVEYELNDNSGGPWLFGRFCYWCGGMQVGNYPLGTSLRDVLFELERIVGDAGKRSNPRFDALSAHLAFKLLNGALFGKGSDANLEVANEEQWTRHLVTPAVDVFDGWKAFLFEQDISARLIVAHAGDAEPREIFLKAGEVDSVLQAVVLELVAVYDEAVSSNQN